MIFEQEFDRELANCINDSAKGYAKQCARSANHHLELAWKIKDLDPEMAIFRAITAEEEAASAIFIALKDKGYDNAKKIKFKRHSYKQALEPFIRSISFFSEKWSKEPGFPFGKNFRLSIEGEDKNKKLTLSLYFKDGMVTAIPPLGFTISLNGLPYHFENELNSLTSGQNKNDIINHINKRANLRNEVLYAQSAGIPKITSNIENHIKKRKNIVFMLLKIYGLIYPYNEKALFVQQALNSFLIMMGDIDNVVVE